MISDKKLVIWDLDETFWDGTLSEGPVIPIQAHVDRIKALCDRGVMNSICSKNDPDVAQAKLEKLDVWEFFVFPSIMWAPKGEQVRQIIDRMKLRAVDVLFVDDNALNREEVRHHNPDIQVLDPVDWDAVDVSGWGKDDRSHSRLANYKLLEAKSEAAIFHRGDNEDFLRKSNIQCKISKFDLVKHDADRVVEVLNRTNQLNFTKRRFQSGVAQLVHDLRRAKSVGYVVHVTDDYGDYGLCGFMSVSGAGDVQDFAFSCRLLDMGVERALLGFLRSKHPDLRVSFQSEIDGSQPDWVSITYDEDRSAVLRPEPLQTQPKVFMAAACFSETIAPFMQPEFSVVGLPDLSPLSVELIRKERRASAMYWSGIAPELTDLFDGKIDILHLFVPVQVMFPAVWVPFLGYIPIPMTLNTSLLKQHPDLWRFVSTAMQERTEYLGRRLEEKDTRRKMALCLALSKNKLFALQTRFCPKTYRKRLNALRARLPEHTRIVFNLSREDQEHAQFSGPLAALNGEVLSRARAANQVVREFVQDSTRTYALDPLTGDDRRYDMASHLNHQQSILFAQIFKSKLLEVMERP